MVRTVENQSSSSVLSIDSGALSEVESPQPAKSVSVVGHSGSPPVVTSVVEKEHSDAESANPFLTIDPGMYLWTVITFVLLLVILSKFAWRPILKALDDREKFISKSLKDAEQAKKDMEEMSQKQEQLIVQANDQAKEMVAKGKEAAERIAKDIEDRAQAEAQKILLNAKREIENEKEQVMSLLRIETTDLVIRATSKFIDANLDDEKNRKLIDATIDGLVDER